MLTLFIYCNPNSISAPSFSPRPTLQIHPTVTLFHSPQGMERPLMYHPALGHQFEAELSSSSPTGDPMVGHRVRDGLHSNYWENHMKIKVHICYKCVGGLCPAPACSLVGSSVFVSPHGHRLADASFFVVFLTPWAHSILFSTLQQDPLPPPSSSDAWLLVSASVYIHC